MATVLISASNDGGSVRINKLKNPTIKCGITMKSDLIFPHSELIIDKLDMIEDTKGNSGDNGCLLITNLRTIWHSIALSRINLSIGYNTFITVDTKIMNTMRGASTQCLHILASFRNCRYEFLFTNLNLKSTRHYTSVMGVYRAFVSSKIYRDIKLRSGIIENKRLILLPQEKIQSTTLGVWNLSVEQGNVGVFIITNIRLVWFADLNHQFNVSIPYLILSNVTVRNSKFGPTLVVLSNEESGSYILGFRVTPLEQLHTLHKEISVFLTTFKKSPIFGVNYTFEHEGTIQPELKTDNIPDIQEDQGEISNVLGYYFSEGGVSQRKPTYANHLGLAVEEPREGSTLNSLWELLPTT